MEINIPEGFSLISLSKRHGGWRIQLQSSHTLPSGVVQCISCVGWGTTPDEAAVNAAKKFPEEVELASRHMKTFDLSSVLGDLI